MVIMMLVVMKIVVMVLTMAFARVMRMRTQMMAVTTPTTLAVLNIITGYRNDDGFGADAERAYHDAGAGDAC